MWRPTGGARAEQRLPVAIIIGGRQLLSLVTPCAIWPEGGPTANRSTSGTWPHGRRQHPGWGASLRAWRSGSAADHSWRGLRAFPVGAAPLPYSPHC
jgi:hypothetical protein